MIIDRAAFIRANTCPLQPPHCPEITLLLADEAVPLWEATEEELQEKGLPPPFWAFAWAGGQALARYLLDNPEIVAGKAIADIASGSGLVAIAAMKTGASTATAYEIDAFALEAIAINAAANAVAITPILVDIIGNPSPPAPIILVGDLFYDRDISSRLIDWLEAMTAQGCLVLVGDPGRSYLPADRLEQVAEYQVAVSRALEDADVKRTRVWRVPKKPTDTL
jgi:predicted nicotinamide N-methyase